MDKEVCGHKDDLKVLLQFLRKGLLVDVLTVDLVQDEKEAYLVKSKIIAHINDCPVFQDLTFRLTKAAAKQMLDKLTSATKS